MPLMRCGSGGIGWKWGASGKCYSGKDAKKKAIKQGLAIGGGKLEKAECCEVDIEIPITKSDADKQMVFGWANVSMSNGQLVVDSHGDTISMSELENAAYEFALHFNSEAVGEMHNGEAKGKLIESVMVTPEKLEAMGLVSKNDTYGWWVGMYVEDKDLFEKVKSGEYRAMSIQGMARRVKDDGK